MKISRKTALTGLAAGLFGLSLTPVANAGDGPVSQAQLLTAQCNACHAKDGGGAKPNPSINGEEVADFVELMQAFASGDEPTSIMDRHSKGYSDDELKMIAEYYSEM